MILHKLIFAQSAIHAGNGYSSAIQGGTTDIMQVNGNVSANTQAPTQTLTTTSDVGVVFDGDIKINSQGVKYFPTGDTSQRGRGRGVFGSGETPSNDKVMDYVEIKDMDSNLILMAEAQWLVVDHLEVKKRHLTVVPCKTTDQHGSHKN